jgi:hypothetical protein
MSNSFSYKRFPRSRIATFDTFLVGLQKHHVSAMLEFDVTESRRKLHDPLSFGIGSVLKKPVVIDNEIRIREILNMTILVDHDVIDGAPMVRFLNDLTKYIESGALITDNSQ